MAGVPNRARAGDKTISANLLNYTLDNALAFRTMQKGLQQYGTHNAKIGAWARTAFPVYCSEDIPPYSVFRIKELDNDSTRLEVEQNPGTKSSALYCNDGQARDATDSFYPYLVSPHLIITAEADAANLPALGDFCQPKAAAWTVEKGGSDFLCIGAPDDDNLVLLLSLPKVGGRQRLGFVVNNDILANSSGTVELYNEFYSPTGDQLQVYNSHGVTFYKESTVTGEEHPADTVILFEMNGWNLPLIFPWLLSECEDLRPVFDPVEI